jgi:hypothetical protein
VAHAEDGARITAAGGKGGLGGFARGCHVASKSYNLEFK